MRPKYSLTKSKINFIISEIIKYKHFSLHLNETIAKTLIRHLFNT